MDINVDRGIIVRIHLKNFVTYDDAVIKPGRNLNVIIGPNGTGKSTIVCAIVLGLGGKPKVIGRALHVGEYVKAGCSTAKIEIELQNPGKKNFLIGRKFNTDGLTEWFLNGTKCSLKDVEQLTSSLNIQVDNLCQFLPQDKVQDFSKMDAQQLLENTQRSVGDPVLLEYHTKLKEHRKEHVELQEYVAKKESVLERQSQKYASLEEIVGGIKERTAIKRKIISLKQKKCWLIYDGARRNLHDAKKKRDEAVTEMNSLRATMKPVDTVIAQLKVDIGKLDRTVTARVNKSTSIARSVSALVDDIGGHEEKIQQLQAACVRKVQAEATRDQEIATALHQQSKLENDLESIMKEFGSEESLLQQQRKILPLIEQHRNFINELLIETGKCKQEEELTRQEIRAQESELQVVKNVEQRRLELLRQRSGDAYKGTMWLRGNADKFAGVVHEPMLLKINVKSAEYSKYFESILPHRDLCAFVCETKQDMNLLLSYLRDQQRLQVNCVHSDPRKHVPMQPRLPLEHIQQFGFEYYLISLVDAPETILKYLVSMYRINNIPIGSNRVEDVVDRIPNSLNCFYSRNNLYSVSVSKYSGEKSTRMSKVTGDRSLSIILDTKKLHNITNNLAQLNERLELVTNAWRKKEGDLRDAEAQMEQFRAQRTECQRHVEQLKNVKSRILMITKKIEDLRSNRMSVEDIQRKHRREISNVLMSQLKVYDEYNDTLSEYIESNNASCAAKLEQKLLQRKLVAKQNEFQDMREKCIASERIVRRYDNDLQPMRAEAKRMYEEALSSTDGIGPQDKAFRKLNTIFEKLPATVDQINEELKVSQAKVFCLTSAQDGDSILKEYEKVKADVENLKEDVKTKTAQIEFIGQQLEEIRGMWMPPLEELVNNINANFSSYLASMNCAGEVTITHGENIMDFEEYGLKIRVKFRDADQLQELTRHHQSGGERAVTTAIYMIALQELSTVPFRCVDEINQGMDAINERRVFELIVNITGKPKGSQYFLLTPKLLPALLYTETATVHCVFNGPFAISHKDFDMNQYCPTPRS